MDKRTARQIIPKKFEHDKSLSQDGAEEFEQSTIIKKKNLCWHFGRNQRSRLFCSVVIYDETWQFQYDPEIEQQSMQWKSPHSPRPRKARISKSNIKTMCTVFFHVQGNVITMSYWANQNQKYYTELLSKLKERIWRRKLELWDNGWIPHQDHAPAHIVLLVQQFLARKQLLYSFIPFTHHTSLCAPFSSFIN